MDAAGLGWDHVNPQHQWKTPWSQNRAVDNEPLECHGMAGWTCTCSGHTHQPEAGRHHLAAEPGDTGVSYRIAVPTKRPPFRIPSTISPDRHRFHTFRNLKTHKSTSGTLVPASRRSWLAALKRGYYWRPPAFLVISWFFCPVVL